MNKKKLPSLVVLVILTAIVTVFCISFNIYRVFTKSPAPIVDKEIILKLESKLDNETLEAIKKRLYP